MCSEEIPDLRSLKRNGPYTIDKHRKCGRGTVLDRLYSLTLFFNF